MLPKPAFTKIFMVLLLLPLLTAAQKPPTPKSTPKTALDSLMLESSVLAFKQSSISPDTAKANLRVRVFEKGGNTDPIQGATVLIRRDRDKMLGRVTKHDGRCLFEPAPATYTVRVQMTGLKSFEKTGFKLEAGKVYDIEIGMARN
ncbi:MAG: carboxypeptidase regulatory-like domain-containing protein [Phycisphaerae bacterium]|nr:carboxypeptidase regulatory-like domain-containing protein [Saprospiraceae bacterium]